VLQVTFRTMAKVVLVSHLERNKKISIPEPNSEGDIDYLRREFLKNFYFEKNVKLQITFQQFDPEWEEYVDLEEDAVVQHKDKLKAIVTPRLSDSAPTTSASASVTDEGGTEFEVTACWCTYKRACTYTRTLIIYNL